MPSATKMASFHSSSMSPRRKSRHASTYPSPTRHSPNPHPTPTSTQSPRLSMSTGATTTTTNNNNNNNATTSSIPTLPDVHCGQSQSGPQWTFLHTLLSQDREEERERGERGTGQDNAAVGSRHTTTDSDGDSGDTMTKDFSSGKSDNTGNCGGGRNKPGASDGVKRRSTGRSSLPGNASHGSSGTTGNATVWRKHQEQSPHNQRQNLNLDDSSQCGFYHPSQSHSPLRSGPKTNATEDKRSANRDVDCVGAENENTRLIQAPNGAVDSNKRTAAVAATAVPRLVANSVNHVHNPAASVGGGGVGNLRSTKRQTPSLPNAGTSHQPRHLREGETQGSQEFAIPNTPLDHTGNVNQWTTSRAVDNCNNEADRDDNDDANENNNSDNEEEENEEEEDVAWHPQTGTRPSQEESSSSRVVGEGCSGPDYTTSSTSRAPSPSSRRKRPLLLPPIMLPPIYSVQPTPLLLRDDVYFATLGPRARRPLSDGEWDRLRDCRYLRIRTRSLKA